MAAKKSNRKSSKGRRKGSFLSKVRIISFSFVITMLLVLATNYEEILSATLSAPANFLKDLFGNTSEAIPDSTIIYASTLDSYYVKSGKASYYGSKFHGRRTANGEVFNLNLNTAAHRTLPFGTIVRVTNTDNDKKTFVRINDRGPFVKKRIIDLSKLASESISGNGLTNVKIDGIDSGKLVGEGENSGKIVAYSYQYELFYTSFYKFVTIDSTKNFTEAVTLYDELIVDYTDLFLLFDPFVEESERTYYLSILRDGADFVKVEE